MVTLALVSLRICVDWSEPSLVDNAINTKIACIWLIGILNVKVCIHV